MNDSNGGDDRPDRECHRVVAGGVELAEIVRGSRVLLERFGRHLEGLAAAQLEPGITADRLYLGAYACYFGATGLTFYNDEVRDFFKTEDEPLLVVALGRPAKGRRL